MIRYGVFIYLLSLGIPVFGQTFFPAPGPQVEKETPFELATECYLFFENPGGDSLQLRWKQIEVNTPASWNIDLCDYGLCYTGIPASGLMNTIADTAQAYLKLIVQPGSSPGVGWLWFRVWENGNPSNFQDVFFGLYTPGLTAVSGLPQAKVEVFPNPGTDFFYVKNPSATALPARIVNSTGQTIWSGILPAQQGQEVSCARWPAGPYYLNIRGKTQLIIRQ